jgi:hypothetical protein
MAVDDRNRGFVHEPSQTFKTYFGKPERILDNIVVYFDLEKNLAAGVNGYGTGLPDGLFSNQK